MTPQPLNGTKTHPLKYGSWLALESLVGCARPSQELNPGAVNRLLREELIELVEQASPYKAHGGRKITFARITDKGRAKLLEKP